MKFKLIFTGLLVGFLFVIGPQAFAGNAVYVLFRHAEKTTESTNPGLTKEGQARAQTLAEYFKDSGVTRIFSTNFRRTRETVAPLARELGLEIENYDPSDLAAFADKLRAMEGLILIVGHSNTTPELAALLSGQETEPMPESEYDRLYTVARSETGETLLDVLTEPEIPSEKSDFQ